MDRNRLAMLGAGLAAVVVIAGGFLFGVQPQLHAADSATSQNSQIADQNASLQTGLVTLKSTYSKLDSLTTQLATLKQSIPSQAGTADLIREYNSLAIKTGTTITNITNGDPVAYTPPVSAAPSTSTSTSTDTASPSPSATASATASPTPTASIAAAPTVTTNAAITPANFSAIPVTVEILGSYQQALAFLQGLHDGSRLFLVTGVTSSVSNEVSSTGTVAPETTQSTAPNDWTISGLIYALTDSSSSTQTQQTPTSTAAGSTTGSSSTDTAAGK